MTTPDLDLNSIIEAIKNGDSLSGKDGALTPLIKQLTEAAMKAELEEHLSQEACDNNRPTITDSLLLNVTITDSLLLKIKNGFLAAILFRELRVYFERS